MAMTVGPQLGTRNISHYAFPGECNCERTAACLITSTASDALTPPRSPRCQHSLRQRAALLDSAASSESHSTDICSDL
ncbi:hypothetical protein AOLI_G00002460 [Acnodon oligacanthus]